jgi:hypothetical protein
MAGIIRAHAYAVSIFRPCPRGATCAELPPNQFECSNANHRLPLPRCVGLLIRPLPVPAPTRLASSAAPLPAGALATRSLRPLAESEAKHPARATQLPAPSEAELLQATEWQESEASHVPGREERFWGRLPLLGVGVVLHMRAAWAGARRGRCVCGVCR